MNIRISNEETNDCIKFASYTDFTDLIKVFQDSHELLEDMLTAGLEIVITEK